MSDTYQKEIPRARVNIALELETGGAVQKSELPLKILVLGDYSNGRDQTDLVERQRIAVDKNNLEQVLKAMAPAVRFEVEDQIGGEGRVEVQLCFDSFRSFEPGAVAAQVPQLNKLMAMRNLLRDLKSNLLDNLILRKELERVLQNRPRMQELKASLDEIVPLQGSVKVMSKDNKESI